MLDPARLPEYVFRDPKSEAARRMFGVGDDPEAAQAAKVRLAWAMGTTSKFIWPLPDKGLKKRIHRVRTPTLLIWGKEDRLVPPVYADEFTRRIASARVQTVDGAGHVPHLERPDAVARMIREFVAGESRAPGCRGRRRTLGVWGPIRGPHVQLSPPAAPGQKRRDRAHPPRDVGQLVARAAAS